MAPGDDATVQDQDRLNGWKEIASFLGKGVRTAQRWERELGLPVHRLGRDGGEIVFAFRSEITAWSLAQDVARRGEVPEPGASTVAPPRAAVEAHGTAGRGPRRRPVVVATLALAGVAIGFLGLRSGWLGPPPQPASWRVSGDTLSVLDEQGARLWTHRLPEPLADAFYTNIGPFPRLLSPVMIADLDADGDREVLIGLVFKDLRSPRQGLVALNHDGTERFWFAPDPVVHFGSIEYRGPWVFHHVFVTQPLDRPPSLWAVFVHGMEFPTLLVELDPLGAVRSEYWSNGYIESLTETTWGGRAVVLAGGTNNETHGASLAIFDRGRVTGSAPAVDPNYRCLDCPAGGPIEFLLFPRRCILRVMEAQPTVTQIWKDTGDRLHVAVTEWGPGPRPIDENVYYWLGPDLTPERAELSPELIGLHRQLERTGYLDHAFGPADEADLFPVRRWNGSTFVDLPTAPVTR